MHGLDAERLKRLFAAGGGAQGVKFVFVSACHSEIAGRAFVGAGVPHVIAVKMEAQVLCPSRCERLCELAGLDVPGGGSCGANFHESVLFGLARRPNRSGSL